MKYQQLVPHIHQITKINIIFGVTIFNLLVSCTDSSYSLDRLLDGKWGVYQLEKNNKSLLNDVSKNFIFTSPLFLDMNSKYLILEIDNKKPIKAQFEITLKEKRKLLRIYNSTDKHFNGLYQMWIDTIFQNPHSDKYRLLLESDSIFLVATKTIVKRIM